MSFAVNYSVCAIWLFRAVHVAAFFVFVGPRLGNDSGVILLIGLLLVPIGAYFLPLIFITKDLWAIAILCLLLDAALLYRKLAQIYPFLGRGRYFDVDPKIDLPLIAHFLTLDLISVTLVLLWIIKLARKARSSS